MREVERRIQIAVIDEKWRDHLYEIDQLRGGIGLRAYGQRDPLLEYKAEAFRMFEELIQGVEEDTLRYLFRVQPAPPPGNAPRPSAPRPTVVAGAPRVAAPRVVREQHAAASGFAAGQAAALDQEERGNGDSAPAPRPAAGRAAGQAGGAAGGPRTVVHAQPKIGRNEPCPCGSGKKYKKCCGVNL